MSESREERERAGERDAQQGFAPDWRRQHDYAYEDAYRREQERKNNGS